ncbi:KUP/HAK/KT family potassium transporter [Candidatus Microgenomates bacterium]|nr:KUP/HAK/KT family potassium transporter [Candidatus Microgenomates bacterium]
MSHTSKPDKSKSKLALLALGALGVVYGDIGTSPLYAIKEIFFGHALHTFTQLDVIGAISIVLWSLTLIVSFKYVFFVLRADNEGEGGVFALYGLIDKLKKKSNAWITLLLIFAAGLLFGDGIITPAISVISAVEGLGVATHTLEPYIIPITIAILAGLFAIQSKGTSKVGTIFGPVMVVWFSVLAVLGITHIAEQPVILSAFNPLHAIQFFMTHSIHTTLLVMGSVMLVVTGGEALYADMGHFGKSPIRLSWYFISYPALLLNYLGQGAYLLSGKHVLEGNIFFSMAPSWGLYPLVILATLATVIASQALISGAFSLASQAVSLGLVPFLDEDHTSSEHEGQIYISFINWTLFAGAVILVLVFKSSINLAAMYGMAVSGVMLVTTLGMIIVSRYIWKWSAWAAYGLFVPLAVVDIFFVVANSLKFTQGGYIPLIIGILFLYISMVWQWGRAIVRRAYEQYPHMTIRELVKKKRQEDNLHDLTRIVMTPTTINSLDDTIPALMQVYLDRYGGLPKHLLFVTVKIVDFPTVKERFTVKNLYSDKADGSIASVTIYFGYMEDPYVEKVLDDLARHRDISVNDDYSKWLIMVVHERIHISSKVKMIRRVQFEIYKLMFNNSVTADFYFGLGYKQPLTIEVLPVHLR